MLSLLDLSISMVLCWVQSKLTVCHYNTTHFKVGKIIKVRDNCVVFETKVCRRTKWWTRLKFFLDKLQITIAMFLQHHCFGNKHCISCKEWRSHWAATKNFLFCDLSHFFASIGQTCFPVFSCPNTSRRLKCQHWLNCPLACAKKQKKFEFCFVRFVALEGWYGDPRKRFSNL